MRSTGNLSREGGMEVGGGGGRGRGWRDGVRE